MATFLILRIALLSRIYFWLKINSQPHNHWSGIKNQIRVLDMITGRNVDLSFTTSWLNQIDQIKNTKQSLYPNIHYFIHQTESLK